MENCDFKIRQISTEFNKINTKMMILVEMNTGEQLIEKVVYCLISWLCDDITAGNGRQIWKVKVYRGQRSLMIRATGSNIRNIFIFLTTDVWRAFHTNKFIRWFTLFCFYTNKPSNSLIYYFYKRLPAESL